MGIGSSYQETVEVIHLILVFTVDRNVSGFLLFKSKIYQLCVTKNNTLFPLLYSKYCMFLEVRNADNMLRDYTPSLILWHGRILSLSSYIELWEQLRYNQACFMPLM